MALIGIFSTSSLECVSIPCSSIRLINFSTKLKIMPRINRIGCNFYSKGSTISCSLSKEAVSSSEFKESGAGATSRSIDATVSPDSVEDEFSHVTKFKMSDFNISDRVSIGLTGRVKFTHIHVTYMCILYSVLRTYVTSLVCSGQ